MRNFMKQQEHSRNPRLDLDNKHPLYLPYEERGVLPNQDFNVRRMKTSYLWERRSNISSLTLSPILSKGTWSGQKLRVRGDGCLPSGAASVLACTPVLSPHGCQRAASLQSLNQIMVFP